MSTDLALVLLVVTFCASCVAVVYLACRIVLSYQKQLSLAAELAIREPYRVNPNQYMVLAHADKVAAGRASSDEAIPVFEESKKTAQPIPETLPLSDGQIPPYEEP